MIKKSVHRISNKEANGNRKQSQFDSTLVPKASVQPQHLGLSLNPRNTENQTIRPQQSGCSSKLATEALRAGSVANRGKQTTQSQAQNQGLCVDHDKVTTYQTEKDTIRYKDQPSRSLVEDRSSVTNRTTCSVINQPFYPSDHMNWTREFPERTIHRQPFTMTNNYRRTSPLRREYCAPQKLCRYYPQGWCTYGERCKFSHVIEEKCGQRREERWDYDQR